MCVDKTLPSFTGLLKLLSSLHCILFTHIGHHIQGWDLDVRLYVVTCIMWQLFWKWILYAQCSRLWLSASLCAISCAGIIWATFITIPHIIEIEVLLDRSWTFASAQYTSRLSPFIFSISKPVFIYRNYTPISSQRAIKDFFVVVLVLFTVLLRMTSVIFSDIQWIGQPCSITRIHDLFRRRLIHWTIFELCWWYWLHW